MAVGGDDLVAAGYDSDDFTPLKRLGYGDMGTVFLATLRSSGEAVAMKVMNKEVVRARKSEHRVERELDILAALDHRFTPKLVSHFETKKHIYFVMDFCPGGDMNTLRQRQPEKRFSENAARFYAAEVCLAIEYLHKSGVIYRDLKPENVLIQEDGHIMLTDFDLSVRIEQQQQHQHQHQDRSPRDEKPSSKKKKLPRSPFMCSTPASVDVVACATRKAVEVKPCHRLLATKIFPSERSKRRESGAAASPPEVRSHSFVGTEEYVAPEMILGSGHGRALDWWTVGIFLYEMIYGTTPFKARNRRETFLNVLSSKPEFPGDWTDAADLISKLLVRDPSKRLGSRGGAAEIKAHPFFRGVDWAAIELVARPPWVPEPLVIDAERMEAVVVEELLKQTVPAAAAEKINKSAAKKGAEAEAAEEAEISDDGSARRSSSASSTITYDEFSDDRSDDGAGPDWCKEADGDEAAAAAATGADSFCEF